MKTNKDQIIIHKDQSSIFDVVEDTTTNKPTIQIKSKPPYHKELFQNVKLISLSDRCTLALNISGYSCYLLNFIYHTSDSSYIMYCPGDEVVNISNTLNDKRQLHFLCKDYASIILIKNHDAIFSQLEEAKSQNDFDKIFDILSKVSK